MINSTEGPGATLRNALWHHEDTKDHVTILYKDPNERGWEDFKSYKWQLIHRPSIGLIHVKIFQGEEVIIDSGTIFCSLVPHRNFGINRISPWQCK